MQGSLARLGSWGRRFLVLGALFGAPMLAAAPAAQAQVVPAVAVLDHAAPMQAIPVQYYGPPRGHYRGRGHWRRPPPGYYGRPHARRHYGPPPRFAGPPRPYAYRYR